MAMEKQTRFRLNDDETIITRYRALTPKERACVVQVIETMLEK